MALLVWSRGYIPESPGHETQPDRRLPGTCPGAGRQRQGPGPSLVETHSPTQEWQRSCEQGSHSAPLLPCLESDSRKEKTLVSRIFFPSLGVPGGPEDAHGGRAGVGPKSVYLLSPSDRSFSAPCTDSAPAHALGNVQRQCPD